MRSHLFHLVVFSALVSAFFAILLRSETRARVRLGGILWFAMVGGALALSWLMVPFPR